MGFVNEKNNLVRVNAENLAIFGLLPPERSNRAALSYSYCCQIVETRVSSRSEKNCYGCTLARFCIVVRPKKTSSSFDWCGSAMNSQKAIRAGKKVILEYSAKSAVLVDIFFLKRMPLLVGHAAGLSLHARVRLRSGDKRIRQGRHESGMFSHDACLLTI